MKNTKNIHIYLPDNSTNHNFCKVHKPLFERFQRVLKIKALRFYLEDWAKKDGFGDYCLNTIENIKSLKKAIQNSLGKELFNEEVYSNKDSYGLCRIWVTRHIRKELEKRGILHDICD